ncbi:tail fiber domain-containing protein [Hyphobacterium sp. CCMP332]|nr:tail fiber domain-containing protein [Hyphobacterium sp. CCMP332]
MRNIFLVCLSITFLAHAQAQNNVGIGTTSPSPRTILHLDNSGSPLGLLLPNVDFTTLTPLAAEEGMLIYDHTRNSIFFWNGSSWDPVVPGWTLNGNAGTSSGTNFIGTTDAQDLTLRTNNIEKIRLTQQGQLEFLNTGGSIFIGQGAGANDDLTLKNNVFVGASAGFSNVSGGFNVGIGGSALSNNVSGSQNTAIGDGAMIANSTGGQNTAIGLGALFNNIDGSTNVAIGLNALFTAPSSSANVAIGYEAMLANTNSNNTAVGFRAMQQNTLGGLNVALGSSSLINNTTGSQNTSVGQSALASNIDGALNTAMGQAALISNTSGSGNTGIGLYALDLNTIGGNNTAVGMQSAFANTTGGGNVAMGFNALASNITGSNNTAIGNTADVDFNNLTNATMIGAGARAGVSNSLILGDPNVRVGIGTSIPLGVLHIEDADWNSNSVILNSNGIVGSAIRFQNSSIGNHVYDIIGSTGSGASTGAGYFGLYDQTAFAYRFVVSPTGNFGIGTTAAINRLDVEGGAAIGSNYSGTSIAPAEGLLVEGQVGIGTSSPVATNKLHVLTPAGTPERYTINAENVYDGASLGIGVWSYMRGSGSGNAYAFYASNSSSTSGLEYGVYSTGEDYNYFSGNVGIQTTVPGYDLTLGATGQVFAVENTGTFVARNSGGTYENYFWPRWSDNIMYMNYGSGGFHIRNNSSVTTMFMTDNNRIGIGTTSPSIWGDIHVAGGTYAVDGTSAEGMKWVSGNTLQADMFRWGNSNNALYVTNNGLGNLTGVYLLPGATSWTSSSDRRLKENINETSYGLDEILRLSVKEYNYNTTENKNKSIGLIAQDVYRIIPEIVQKGDDGDFRGSGNAEESAELGFEPWGINYTELVPVLVKALQELNSKNEELQKRIEFLESE